jgi:hypothetical protein
MSEKERTILAQMQLSNIGKLLNGEVSHQTIVNSRGEVLKRYLITYEDPSDN